MTAWNHFEPHTMMPAHLREGLDGPLLAYSLPGKDAELLVQRIDLGLSAFEDGSVDLDEDYPGRLIVRVATFEGRVIC